MGVGPTFPSRHLEFADFPFFYGYESWVLASWLGSSVYELLVTWVVKLWVPFRDSTMTTFLWLYVFLCDRFWPWRQSVRAQRCWWRAMVSDHLITWVSHTILCCGLMPWAILSARWTNSYLLLDFSGTGYNPSCACSYSCIRSTQGISHVPNCSSESTAFCYILGLCLVCGTPPWLGGYWGRGALFQSIANWIFIHWGQSWVTL